MTQKPKPKKRTDKQPAVGPIPIGDVLRALAQVGESSLDRNTEFERFKNMVRYAVKSGDDVREKLRVQYDRLKELGFSVEEIQFSIDSQGKLAGGSIDYKMELPKERYARSEIPLHVPFAEKDQAKALGARWKRMQRIWVAPAGSDLYQFKKWLY